MGLIRRFGNLLRGNAVQREVDEELAFHLDERTRHYIGKGMAPEAARKEAERQFGSRTLSREETRDRNVLTGLESVMRDLRYAIRSVRYQPGYSLVAILILSLAIGANTAVFTVIQSVLLNSLPYQNPEGLVQLSEADENTPQPITSSYGTYVEWRRHARAFEAIELYRGWTGTLSGHGQATMLSGSRVTAGFFRLLGVEPLLGRDFEVSEDTPDTRYVVMLGHSFWQRRFGGSPNVLGEKILIDEQPFEIVGVLPASFRPTLFGGPDVWAPLGYHISQSHACRGCQHLRAVARLSGGVSTEQARADINGAHELIKREYPRDYRPDAYVRLTPLREYLVGRLEGALYLLVAATGLLLAIACANIANLCIVRATARKSELSLRAALGAGRMRIVRQLLFESLLIAGVSGAVGILLAVAGVPLLVQLAPPWLPRLDEIQLDGWVLGSCLAASLLTAVGFGLLPALSASRLDLRSALSSSAPGAGGTRGAFFSRQFLVGAQVALAFVLVAGTSLLVRSLVNLWQVEPGFRTENVLTFALDLANSRYRNDAAVLEAGRLLIERLEAVPGVESAALTSVLPLMGFDRRGFHVEDRPIPSTESPSADTYWVSPHWFETMGIPLKRGRLFTAEDTPDSMRVALIGETTARQLWPDEDPLGKRIQLGGRNADRPWYTIVGIVGDVRQYGLDREPTLQAYQPATQIPVSYFRVALRTRGDPDLLKRSVQEAIAAFDSDLAPYGMQSMEALLAGTLAERRYVAMLLTLFGALALTLAAIGIYGVLAYVVTKRHREIGVRMALGATVRNVVSMVLRQGGACVAAGMAAGLALAAVCARFLEQMLFGVTPADPLALSLTAALLGLCGLLASLLPAARAARLDPSSVLRAE